MKAALLTVVVACIACDHKDVAQHVAADLTGPSTGMKPLAPLPITLPLDEMAHPDHGTLLTFDVLPGVHLVATRTSLQPQGIGTFTWTGSTPSHGLVVITSHNGAVVGTVFDHGTWYRIVRINHSLVVLPLVPRHWPKTVPYKHLAAEPKMFYDGPIELVVAYTKKAASDCSDIETEILNAIEVTNQIAANSGLTTRFHLAYGYETTYSESHKDLETIVEDFAGSGANDQTIPEIHGLRRTHSGDIAVLFVSADAGDAIGISAATTADFDHAFSVVDCASVPDLKILTHELGHLLGLNDDWDTETTYPNGFGSWKDTGSGSAAASNWHTIMASGMRCKNDCSNLIPYWANPHVDYEGTPTGVPGVSEDTTVIGDTQGAISQFEVGHPETEWGSPVH